MQDLNRTSISPAFLLRLQRTVGNRQVVRLVESRQAPPPPPPVVELEPPPALPEPQRPLWPLAALFGFTGLLIALAAGAGGWSLLVGLLFAAAAYAVASVSRSEEKS